VTPWVHVMMCVPFHIPPIWHLKCSPHHYVNGITLLGHDMQQEVNENIQSTCWHRKHFIWNRSVRFLVIQTSHKDHYLPFCEFTV